MRFLDEPLFQAIFNSSTPRLIVKTDFPHFTIEARNSAFDALSSSVDDLDTATTLSALCSRMWDDAVHCKKLEQTLAEAIGHSKRLLLPPPKQAIQKETTFFNFAELDITSAQSHDYSYLIVSFVNANSRQIQQLADEGLLRENVLRVKNRQMQQSVDEGLQREDALGTALTSSQAAFNNQTEALQKSQQDFTDLTANLETKVQLRTQVLALSEARFRRMVQEAPIAIGILRGRSLVIESANSQLLHLWGKTSDVLLRPLAEALPELEGQPFLQLIDEVYTSRQPYYGSALPARLMHDGELKNGYCNFVYYPLAEEDGETRIMLVANDVTPQIEAAQRVAISQRRLQSVISNAPIGITVLKGTDLVVELANDPMLSIWGRTREQMIGSKLLDVFPELLDQPFPKMLLNIFASGNPLEISEIPVDISSINGSIAHRYVDFSYNPLLDEAGKVEAVLVIVRDITEQVEYRKAIEHAQEMSRLAIEASDMGDWHLDLQTQQFTASPRLKELYGFPIEEDMPFEEAMQQIPEQHRERVLQAIDKTLQEGAQYDVEFPLNIRNQDRTCWVKAIGRLFTESSGKATYFAGVKMDITERRENEQRKNDFIGMVSHELKTPLTSLKGYVQILQMKAEQEKDIFRINTLDKAGRQINRMQRMINGFLSIAALESGKLQLMKESFNLMDVVKEALEDAILNYPKITFRLKDHVKLPVEADRDKISQVMINLLSNGVKYSPQGKYIDVVCRQEEGMAVVSIRDEGIGISSQNLEKLFERFYRVESEQMKNIAGFGIGLYLCYEIIRLHSGRIWAESKEGEGSTFYFSLPLLLTDKQ